MEARGARGDWRGAYVLASGTAGVRVHFEGFADALDETVPRERVRPRTATTRRMTRAPEGLMPPASPPPARFAVGDRVDVFWGDVWWKALVLAREGERFLVHYDGWPEDDEAVPASRMRAYTARPEDGPLARAFEALERRDCGTARERFRHALSQNEGDSEVWSGSAQTHLVCGEPAGALADALRLAASEPGGPAGWLLAAAALSALAR